MDGSLSRFAVMAALLAAGACAPVRTAPDLCSSGEPPPSPTQLTATPGPGAITLQWVNPTHPTFSATRILRRLGSPPTSPDDTAALVVYDGRETTVTDSAFVVGASYEYRAWARSTCKRSLYSVSSAAASSSPLMPGPPPPPTRLQISPGPHSLRLAWLNPTFGSFAGVLIRRSETGFPANPDDGSLVSEGLERTFLDDSLTPMKTYYYAVYSKDGYGQVSSDAARISGVPDWEYQDVQVPPLDAWERFPTFRCGGDCDFAGHGPVVEISVELKRDLWKFWVEIVVFKAVETAGDRSCAQKDLDDIWATNTYRVEGMEGWIFDSYPLLPSVREDLQYTDETLTMDYRYGQTVIDYVTVMGETAEFDICSWEEDDTHLHRLRTRPITIRVRR